MAKRKGITYTSKDLYQPSSEDAYNFRKMGLSRFIEKVQFDTRLENRLQEAEDVIASVEKNFTRNRKVSNKSASSKRGEAVLRVRKVNKIKVNKPENVREPNPLKRGGKFYPWTENFQKLFYPGSESNTKTPWISGSGSKPQRVKLGNIEEERWAPNAGPLEIPEKEHFDIVATLRDERGLKGTLYAEGSEAYTEAYIAEGKKRGLVEEMFAPGGEREFDNATSKAVTSRERDLLKKPGQTIDETLKNIPEGLGKYTWDDGKTGPSWLRKVDWDPEGIHLNQTGLDILAGKELKFGQEVQSYLEKRWLDKIKDLSPQARKELVARYKKYYTMAPKPSPLESAQEGGMEDFFAADILEDQANKDAREMAEGVGLSRENVLDIARVSEEEITDTYLSRDLARVHRRTGAFARESTLLGGKRKWPQKDVDKLPKVGKDYRYIPATRGEEDLFSRVMPEGSQTPVSLKYLDLSPKATDVVPDVIAPVSSRRIRGISTPRRAALRREIGRQAMAKRDYQMSLPVPVGEVEPLTRASQGRAKSQAASALTRINEDIKLIALQPDTVRPSATVEPLSFDKFLLSDNPKINVSNYPGTRYGMNVSMGGKKLGEIPYGSQGNIRSSIEAGRGGALINELAEAEEIRGFAKRAGWEWNPKVKKNQPVVWADIYARNKEGTWAKHTNVPVAGVRFNMKDFEYLFPKEVKVGGRDIPLPEEAALLDREISAQMTRKTARVADNMAKVESENVVKSSVVRDTLGESEGISKWMSKWKLPKGYKSIALIAGAALATYLVASHRGGKESSTGLAGETADKSLYGGLSGKVLYPEGMEEEQRQQNSQENSRMPTSYSARVQDPNSYQTNVRIKGKTKYKADYSSMGGSLGKMLATQHGAGGVKVNVRAMDDSRNMSDEHIKHKIARLV